MRAINKKNYHKAPNPIKRLLKELKRYKIKDLKKIPYYDLAMRGLENIKNNTVNSKEEIDFHTDNFQKCADYNHPLTKILWLTEDQEKFINSITLPKSSTANDFFMPFEKSLVVMTTLKNNVKPFLITVYKDKKEVHLVPVLVPKEGESQTNSIYPFSELNRFKHSMVVDSINKTNNSFFRNKEERNRNINEVIAISEFLIKLQLFLMLDQNSVTPVLIEGEKATTKSPNITIKSEGLITKHYHQKSLHAVRPHYRQLTDDKYYQGDFKDYPRGSRYTLVSGHLRGTERNFGIKNDTEELT